MRKHPTLIETMILVGYDNGMINRLEPVSEFVGRCEELLGGDGMYEADLVMFDAWLSTLQEQERVALAAGGCHGLTVPLSSDGNPMDRLFDDVLDYC